MLSVVVLISGSGSNLRALIDASAAPDYPARIVAVGADRDAAGLQHARDAAIPTFVVRPSEFPDREAWGRAFLAEVQRYEPGLTVSAGLMRILPAAFVHALAPRLVNTHPALLPAFPGAHAVRDALAAGVTETGVTVHVVDEGVDTGPVLRQATVPVAPGETEETVHERIKQVERPLLVQTVREIATGDLRLPASP